MDLSNLSPDSLNLSLTMDIIVLLVLLISVATAFFSGFLREVLNIAGIIGGLVAAIIIGPGLKAPVADMLGVAKEDADKLISPIPNDLIVAAIAYGGVMLSVVVALSVASFFLSKKLKDTGLGPIDRTLGVFFGLARAVIVLGFLYLPFYLMVEPEKREEYFPKAVSRVYVEWSAAGVKAALPEKLIPEEAKPAESELAKFTRDKLKEIDVLKDSAPKALETAQGYTDNSRDQLEALIHKENQSYND